MEAFIITPVISKYLCVDCDIYISISISLLSGIDIKDIPNVNDHDFSITINGFFLVRWFDHRLILEDVKFGAEGDDLVPVDISLVSGDIWLFRDRLL